jgi:hypothetical protein
MSLSGEKESFDEEATASRMSPSGSEGEMSLKRSFPTEQDTDRELKR